MKYRSYKVVTFEAGYIEGDSNIKMSDFLDHVNKTKEKIMHIIPVGDRGLFVTIITLGQDDAS